MTVKLLRVYDEQRLMEYDIDELLNDGYKYYGQYYKLQNDVRTDYLIFHKIIVESEEE